MGRRNLQLGRGDRRSAFRIAIFIFLVSVIGGLLGAHHVPDLGEELGLITLDCCVFTRTGCTDLAALHRARAACSEAVAPLDNFVEQVDGG